MALVGVGEVERVAGEREIGGLERARLRSELPQGDARVGGESPDVAAAGALDRQAGVLTAVSPVVGRRASLGDGAP